MNCEYCAQPLEQGGRICRMCGMLVSPDAAVAAGAARGGRALFPVAAHKFLVLSFCSLNLYQVYWFYQNWTRIRDTSAEAMSPFWRTFFGVLWVIPFLQQIRKRADERSVPVPWSAGALGVSFMLLSFLWRLPDPWWLIVLGTGPLLLPVVETCRRINESAENPEGLNDRYTAGNVATIVAGSLFLLLIAAAVISPA